MSLAPARSAALEVLAEVRRRGAFAPAILDAVLEKRHLTSADRALATRLAYGTLQAEGTLDEALDSLLSRPKLEPRVRDALRLAAYELLFARTPARAAVNEGVEAVRKARAQAAGMANAVLRRLAERAESFPWGDPDTDLAALARATAHPRWLVDRLVADHGETVARDLLWADETPAPLYLAHNPFRASFEDLLRQLEDEGVAPERCGLEGCVKAGSSSAAVRSAALREGLAVVMDAAAQVAPLALAAKPGETVADIAAGRGSKTMLLQAHAVAAGGPASIYAMDLHPFKVRVLADRMGELGVPGVHALVGDATEPEAVEGLPSSGSFDRVLVDAPCSNSGTLRRHPEKRWRLAPEDIGRLAALQSRMLAAAARLVRPRGLVVYSTCSIFQAENGGVIERLLDESAGRFRLMPVAENLPEEMGIFVKPDGTFQSLPSPNGPDGHFVAVLQRMD